MNLFRSEEHARRWSGFGDPGGLLPLDGVRRIWGTTRYRERLSGRYISDMAGYTAETNEARRIASNGHPFWTGK